MVAMTVAEIDDALRQAWETHLHYDTTGDLSGATSAMSYINRLLELRQAATRELADR